MLDADGQHDPRDIPRVAKCVSIGKADLVIGSRFLEKHSGIPYYRQIGQKTLDIFTNIGAKTNGYRFAVGSGHFPVKLLIIWTLDQMGRTLNRT